MRTRLSQAWQRVSGRSLTTNSGLPSELSQLADDSMSTPRVLRSRYLLARAIVSRQIAGDFVEHSQAFSVNGRLHSLDLFIDLDGISQ